MRSVSIVSPVVGMANANARSDRANDRTRRAAVATWLVCYVNLGRTTRRAATNSNEIVASRVSTSLPRLRANRFYAFLYFFFTARDLRAP